VSSSANWPLRLPSGDWFKPKGSTEQRFRGQQLFTFQKSNDTWLITQIVDQTR
jgi:hypothetical protein